jgi:hypothetical protein
MDLGRETSVLSSLRIKVRIGLFHLPLHCLRWEAGEARHCNLKEALPALAPLPIEDRFPHRDPHR